MGSYTSKPSPSDLTDLGRRLQRAELALAMLTKQDKSNFSRSFVSPAEETFNNGTDIGPHSHHQEPSKGPALSHETGGSQGNNGNNNTNNNENNDDSHNDDDNDDNVVCFDVGGVFYKISCATLEMYPDCMLTTIASRRWHQGKKTHFIDRDGRRFQYVLDYMRDGGKVNLPVTVSPSAVAQELDYFGFHDVDQSSIVGGVLEKSMMQSLQGNAYVKIEQINRDLADLERQQKRLKAIRNAMKTAHVIFMRSTSLPVGQRTNLSFSDYDDRTALIGTGTEEPLGELKKFLDQYGLKLIKYPEYRYSSETSTITIERLR